MSRLTGDHRSTTIESEGKPVVAVVDAPGGGYVDDPDIEQRILGHAAEVRLHIVPEGEHHLAGGIDADYLILWHRVRLARGFFETAKRCRAVVCASVGYDHVDRVAAAAGGVPVFHVPHYGSEEVADHALALALSLARRLPELDRHVRSGGWDWQAIGDARRLREMTCGLIGFGRIGMAVAQRMKALGMRVVFHDPYTHPGIEKPLTVERVHRLDDLLGQADIVSVHVPLDTATRHLLGARELGLLKPGAILVNTARGAVVDAAALRTALEDRRPAYVGLDVVEDEPGIPQWLREHPRALVTPHAAFYSVQSLTELRTRAAEAVLQMLDGTQVTSAFAVP
jgi:phosphoglycerate dehydrogenase-like enzyme